LSKFSTVIFYCNENTIEMNPWQWCTYFAYLYRRTWSKYLCRSAPKKYCNFKGKLSVGFYVKMNLSLFRFYTFAVNVVFYSRKQSFRWIVTPLHEPIIFDNSSIKYLTQDYCIVYLNHSKVIAAYDHQRVKRLTRIHIFATPLKLNCNLTCCVYTKKYNIS